MSQTKHVSIEVPENLETVEDIQSAFVHILTEEAKASLDTTVYSYDDQGEKNGNVIFYSDSGEISMIKHEYNEYDHFSGHEEYYIWNDQLFFVFQKEITWSFVAENETKDDVLEKRFYLINGEPIKCLEKKFTIISDADHPPKSEEVPNLEVECKDVASITESYQNLLSHN